MFKARYEADLKTRRTYDFYEDDDLAKGTGRVAILKV